MPGSPADVAGLKAGNIIQRINGKKVSDVKQIQDDIKGKKKFMIK